MHISSSLLAFPALTHLLQYVHSSPVAAVILLPLLLIFCDVVTGVGAALKEHRFRWYNLNIYLSKDFKTYVTIVLVLTLAFLVYDVPVVVTLAGGFGLATLSAEILASIVGNVRIIAGTAASEVAQSFGDGLLVQYGKSDQVLTSPPVAPSTPASVTPVNVVTPPVPVPVPVPPAAPTSPEPGNLP